MLSAGDTLAAKQPWQQLAFFAVLIGILVFVAAGQWIAGGVLLVALALILWRWFRRAEIKEWMKETAFFVRRIIPWLLVGVFIAGILKVAIPESVITGVVGVNSLSARFI